MGAHRVVAIQADGHAELASERLCRRELLLRLPLKIQIELDLAGVIGRKAHASARMRIPELRGPAEPARVSALRRGEVPIERVEARVQLQELSAGRHEALERDGTLGAGGEMAIAELVEQQAQDLELDLRHARVVDVRSAPELEQAGLEGRLADA